MPKVAFDPARLAQAPGHQSCVLLDVAAGCTGECLAGMSRYQTETFSDPQTHPFQEGFYVVAGSGVARIGDDEFPVAAGDAFLVPRQTPHALRKDGECEFVQVFWFHSE